MYQLPKALPDELLLSRLIRFITISGISSSEFLQTCFGSKRISLHPFLTSGLSSIAKVCNEDANLLLKEQTLAPLFCFFLPAHSQKLNRMMFSNNGAKAFRASQLASFGSGRSLGLKLCPICVQHDLVTHGVSYWHRSHQVPGVDTCGYHGTDLFFHNLTQRQRLIKRLLPEHGIDIQYSSSIECKVARFSNRLLRLLETSDRIVKITDAYHYFLKEKGYLTHSGRVRRKVVMQEFCQCIANHSEKNPAIIPRGHTDFRYISQLLGSGSHHPYRHLMFCTWLIGDVCKISSYSQELSVDIDCSAEKVSRKESIADKCLAFLKAGMSMANVSRETGKSRCYIKRLALLNNVRINLKPKLLTQPVVDAIYELAHSGFHRREIARRCNVGIGSVEQIISNSPGLTERRKLCHFESTRRKHRLLLFNHLNFNINATRKSVKNDCSAAFFWLYLNDREWLEKTFPKAKAPKGRYHRGD